MRSGPVPEGGVGAEPRGVSYVSFCEAASINGVQPSHMSRCAGIGTPLRTARRHGGVRSRVGGGAWLEDGMGTRGCGPGKGSGVAAGGDGSRRESVVVVGRVLAHSRSNSRMHAWDLQCCAQWTVALISAPTWWKVLTQPTKLRVTCSTCQRAAHAASHQRAPPRARCPRVSSLLATRLLPGSVP